MEKSNNSNILNNEEINKIVPEKSRGTKRENTSQDEQQTLINSLIEFERHVKSIENINSILAKENLEFLKKLALKDNPRINLLLSKIYLNIISNNSLYNEYLLSIKGSDKDKINNLFILIESCISLVEKLNTFIISSEIFHFKNKILELLKCIYYNCRTKIKDDEKLAKLLELMNSLPSKFFSQSFLELNKSRDLYEVSTTKSQEKISLFEEQFSKINNYYEQYDVFKKFIQYNSGANFSSIHEESFNNDGESQEKGEDDDSSFYISYGTLILKFCKYHKYMFLDKEEETPSRRFSNDEEEEDKNKRIIFLFDKKEKNKEEENIEREQKVQNLLKNKQFTSLVDCKEYRNLIKTEIKYYLNITKHMEEIPRIKLVREHLLYYLKTLDIETYYPLYLKNFTKISINDNFTPSFSINVPAGSVNKLYFETPKDEDTFIYLEFSLEDKTKDINFELNKFEPSKNKYISMFKEEKIKNTFTFLIFCDDYFLYEIVFDNYYSWFNSKDINYRISLLKLKKKDEKEYDFLINGKNYSFNKETNINKEEQEPDIPIILNMNSLRICSSKLEESEKDINNDNKENELVFKEYKENDEKIIPKHLFNYLLVNHIKKNNPKHDKKRLKISIFSQNPDLLNLSKELKEKYEQYVNFEEKNYIKYIGFIPDEKLDDFIIKYQLFDKNEQIIFNHIFSCINEDMKISNSILIIEFSDLDISSIVWNNGEFYSKVKGKKYDLNNIDIDKIDELLYLIKDIHGNFEGLEIIICLNNDIKEENKTKISEQIEKIKKYCQEIVNPPIKIYEYNQEDICQNAVKNMNLFLSEY